MVLLLMSHTITLWSFLVGPDMVYLVKLSIRPPHYYVVFGPTGSSINLMQTTQL